ncbi:hypothetical protein E4J66_13685 [Actinomyces viscosus]|nr:hypothetical protein E4J66_13685 [Actinomyces viscosus]
MAYLNEILSIGEGHSLPEGAQVTSVSPATRFAESFPGGWGYVIAFTASDPSIRTYVTDNTVVRGDRIEVFPKKTKKVGALKDVDLDGINNPWSTDAFPDATLVLERPLGRGWLVIRGAPR